MFFDAKKPSFGFVKKEIKCNPLVISGLRNVTRIAYFRTLLFVFKKTLRIWTNGNRDCKQK